MAIGTHLAGPLGGLRGRSRSGLREDERSLLASAGAVLALASAGTALSGAAADAMFLAAVGPGHLGEALAVSSALLALGLAVIGALADRLERRRVLATLAFVSAGVLASLTALSMIAPTPAAVVTLVLGKQLAAATDLAFWIVIAERVDARRSQRVLPALAAIGGLGAVAGSILVVPLAAAGGTPAVLLAGAVAMLASGALAWRLHSTRRVGAARVDLATLISRSWRDGARAVRANPLATHLAVVVATAGVFGTLAYFAMAVEVSARGGTAADLATLLGGVRGAAQAITLVVQLAIAPRVIARLGSGRALLVAPAFAAAAGLGLLAAPVLAVAIGVQVSARVLDVALETPSEKLAQTLVPTSVRGRIAGFLDGTAKRGGAVLGGVIAALLVDAPSAFYLVVAVAAVVWLMAAARVSRALPALALARVSEAADPDAIVDQRAIELLIRELSGPVPGRAAEVLARLHVHGNVDATVALVGAIEARRSRGIGADLWLAVTSVLVRDPRPGTSASVGPRIAALIPDLVDDDREHAIRALGLAGGVDPDVVDRVRMTDDEPALVLTREVARARLGGDVASIGDLLRDAARDPEPTARAAIDELSAELIRALARSDAPTVLAVARPLTRAVRRGRGDVRARAYALSAFVEVVGWARSRRDAELSLLRSELLEMTRDRVTSGMTPAAPAHSMSSLMRPAARRVDDAMEVAAALELYGALLEGSDGLDRDDLRNLTRALGEPDDAVREAAERVLVALGPAAAGELVETAAWGRRRARDRAAALLAHLPVPPATLDRLVDAELDGLDQTHAAIAALSSPRDALLARRLEERLREVAHTVLLLVAARQKSRPIAHAAVAWRHAHGAVERSRTLAVIEAALPRPLVTRLVEAVDDRSPRERAALLTDAAIPIPARDDVIRTELVGRDRLARALALHQLEASGLAHHRDTITEAARAEALTANPIDLVRRVNDALAARPAPATEGADMPSRVETLIALSRVPLLAPLSTRQLADVAERARWDSARDGAVIVNAGDPLDALLVLESGELRIGDRTIGVGEAVDELACFAPAHLDDDLLATRASRWIRLDRIDLEELVDDVPGLGAAVCRALAERARSRSAGPETRQK